jgi:hypothetical protein
MEGGGEVGACITEVDAHVLTGLALQGGVCGERALLPVEHHHIGILIQAAGIGGLHDLVAAGGIQRLVVELTLKN